MGSGLGTGDWGLGKAKKPGLGTGDWGLGTRKSKSNNAEAKAEVRKFAVPSPESRVPSPESRVPSPESRVPSPESRVLSPESQLYNSIPSRLAMVKMSLSPRPERLHRINASLGISRASFIACATAWLDSSAASMPSVRASK